MGKSCRTNVSTLRLPLSVTPHNSSLATTGENRTGRRLISWRAASNGSALDSSGIWMLVSKKAIIDLGRFESARGIPENLMRVQLFLLFGEESVDEID